MRGKLLFLLFAVLLLSFVCVSAAENESTSATEKIYQDYGTNLDKFIQDAKSKDPSFFSSQAKNINAFVLGFQTSKDDKKIEKLMQLFGDFHKDGANKGQNIINDEFRNEIWKKIIAKDPKKYLSVLADKKFKEKYTGVLKDLSKYGLKDRIDIKDAEKLVWKGNKLGIPSKDGKSVTAWVDFDNLPRWADSVKYENGKFTMDFDTGLAKKSIDFTGGTIGASGELIGPDGNKIGSAFGGALKSIKYDSTKKELSVEYNVDGKSKTLVLTESMLSGSALQKYKEALDDPKLGPTLKKILENPQGYTNDMSVGESGVGFPADNQLNLLYSYGESKDGQKISVSFDEEGRPEIKSSYGSQFVTTNSKGEAKISYESGSTDDKGEGIYKFDKTGEIYATQNSIVKDNKGSFSAPPDKMVGMNIITNNYVEYLAKGEEGRKELMETFLKENDVFARSMKDPTFNIQNELSNIIQRELDNGDFKVALLNQITRATNDLLITSKEASSSLFAGIFGESPEAMQIRDGIYDYTKGRVEGTITDLLSNPDQISKFAGMNEDQRREFLKTQIKTAFNQDPRLAYVYDNDFINPILDRVDSIRTAVAQNEQKPVPLPIRDVVTQEVNTMLDNLLKQSANKEGGFNGKAMEGLIDQLPDNYFGLVGDVKDKEALKKTVAEMRSDVLETIDQAKSDFIEKLKKDNSLGDYKERVIIDHKLHEVKITGSGMTYNTNVPLNKFSVDNAAGDRDVWLYSNGNPVVNIKGDKIESIMNPSNKDYSAIGLIVNEQIPGDKNVFRLESQAGKVTYCGSRSCPGHKSSESEYRLFNPGKTTVVSSGTQPGTASKQVWVLDIQVPFIASKAELLGPEGLDIGNDPDAKLVVTNVARPTARGLLGGIKNNGFEKEMSKKYPEGFPLSEEIVPKFTQQFNDQLEAIKTNLGGETQFTAFVNNNYEMMQDLRKQGVDVAGMSAVEDSLALARQPQLYYDVMAFLNTQKLPRGAQFEITPTYISVNGNKFGEGKPEYAPVFRTMLRTVRKDPSTLYSPKYVKG